MNISEYELKLKKLVSTKFSKLSLIIASFCLVFGLSFGLFMVTTEDYKASEMYIGNLLYTMDLRVIENASAVSGNTVTIPGQYTYTLMVDIGSLNPVRSKYKLQYNTTCTDCIVFISDVSGWQTQGYINADGVEIDTKTVKVIIQNPSNSAATVDFAVTGGYAYNGESIEKTDGYSEDFEDYYVDSSISNVIKTIVKDDTECIPTSSVPCYYGGEEERNYITNNEKIYRMLGVYVVDGVEYVKIVQVSNESASTTYSNLSTSYTNYLNSLSNFKSNYITGNASTISKEDYIKIGGIDSYLNSGQEILTNTPDSNNVYYVNSAGELLLKTQSAASNYRPVLTLKTDATVRASGGDGSVDNPYVITDSLSDIIINTITVDGAYVQNVPTRGVYTMTPTCTGGTATWKDKNYLMEFDVTAAPIICDLSFARRDVKFNVKVNNIVSNIPTTGNYTMTYDCIIGDAELEWDNTDHSVIINTLYSPILCNLNFTSL